MIYLDNNASTEPDPEVLSAVDETARLFGNPSSLHAEGRRARRAIEEARDEVSALLNARADEIVFTSGATEANALAIFGTLAGRRGRVVLTGAEHPSVREPVEQWSRREGIEVVSVNPEATGMLDPARILAAVNSDTALVSVMAANNEFGGIFPIAEIASAARLRGAVVHTDGVQAVGRLPVDVRAWEVDLLSCSAHKMHGPRGVGALFVRKGISLSPHTPGGGQERRLRAGTENTAGIVGFGVAARLARGRMAESGSIARLRDHFEKSVLTQIRRTRIIGADAPRLANTSAILFDGVSGEALAARLDLEGIAASVGSACSSGTTRPSPAILSLGIDPTAARGVLRFSLSRLTTEGDIAHVVAVLPGLVATARRAQALAPAMMAAV